MPVRPVRLSDCQAVRVCQAVSSLSGARPGSARHPSHPHTSNTTYLIFREQQHQSAILPASGLSDLSDLSHCQAVKACQAGLDTHDTRRAWFLSRTPDTSLTLALASPTFYVSGLSRLSDSCQAAVRFCCQDCQARAQDHSKRPPPTALT